MACRPHSCVWGRLLPRRAGRTQGQPAQAGLGRHKGQLSRFVRPIRQKLTPRSDGVVPRVVAAWAVRCGLGGIPCEEGAACPGSGTTCDAVVASGIRGEGSSGVTAAAGTAADAKPNGAPPQPIRPAPGRRRASPREPPSQVIASAMPIRGTPFNLPTATARGRGVHPASTVNETARRGPLPQAQRPSCRDGHSQPSHIRELPDPTPGAVVAKAAFRFVRERR